MQTKKPSNTAIEILSNLEVGYANAALISDNQRDWCNPLSSVKRTLNQMVKAGQIVKTDKRLRTGFAIMDHYYIAESYRETAEQWRIVV